MDVQMRSHALLCRRDTVLLRQKLRQLIFALRGDPSFNGGILGVALIALGFSVLAHSNDHRLTEDRALLKLCMDLITGGPTAREFSGRVLIEFFGRCRK